MEILQHFDFETAREHLLEKQRAELAEFDELHTRAVKLFSGGGMAQNGKPQAPPRVRDGTPNQEKKRRGRKPGSIVSPKDEAASAVDPKIGGSIASKMRSVIKNFGRAFTAKELR